MKIYRLGIFFVSKNLLNKEQLNLFFWSKEQLNLSRSGLIQKTPGETREKLYNVLKKLTYFVFGHKKNLMKPRIKNNSIQQAQYEVNQSLDDPKTLGQEST